MIDYVLLNGDCLNLMSKMSENSVDIVITDPPYGKTRSLWDKIIPIDEMWYCLNNITKHTIILMADQPFSSKLIISNIKRYKHNLIWKKNKKTGFLNAKYTPLRQTEDILIFYEKFYYYNPQKTYGHNPVNKFIKHNGDGQTLGTTLKGFSGGGQTSRYPTNIIEFNVVNNDDPIKRHPNQKPVKLMEYLIKTYSKEKDTILDFAMGSGTTGVACRNLNRNFIGIDIDRDNVNIAKDRIENELEDNSK